MYIRWPLACLLKVKQHSNHEFEVSFTPRLLYTGRSWKWSKTGVPQKIEGTCVTKYPDKMVPHSDAIPKGS